MKVVIFCGGLGLRLREYSENVPKPLVPIGEHPIIWHLMKYYSYYGHKDFVLCLGHKGDAIKRFFLDYREALSNDFVLSDAGRQVQLLSTDFANWRVTCVDTGSNAKIGERLLAVRDYLKDEDVFLANYVDGLSDVNLNMLIETFRESKTTVSFISVPPTQTFHLVETDGSVHGYIQRETTIRRPLVERQRSVAGLVSKWLQEQGSKRQDLKSSRDTSLRQFPRAVREVD